MAPITLSISDLLLAAISLVIASVLSILLALNIYRSLAIAALRMVAQLLLVGLMLRYVFALSSPALTLLVVAGMISAATYEVYSRQKSHFHGWRRFGLGGLPP